ncbi:hypothetical protein LTR49_028797 [Elasticomyces elasticus]|nr:hypothetical protein LTR49_028797 [Elasticomyces elasticus]
MSMEELGLLADKAGHPTHVHTKTVLQKYFERDERSLLCYYKCSTEELHKFAQDRGIAASAGAFNGASLLLHLEARISTTSASFMDFPPELRKLVYGYHLAGLPEV